MILLNTTDCLIQQKLFQFPDFQHKTENKVEVNLHSDGNSAIRSI
jgi:hypothetical protein